MIAISMLVANIDDYVIEPTFAQKVFTVVMEVGLAILLDIIVNYIIYKILRNSENITFKSLVKTSLIIILINFSFILFS